MTSSMNHNPLSASLPPNSFGAASNNNNSNTNTNTNNSSTNPLASTLTTSLFNSTSNSTSNNTTNVKQLFDLDNNKENNINQMNINRNQSNPMTKIKLNIQTNNQSNSSSNNHFIFPLTSGGLSSPTGSFTLLPFNNSTSKSQPGTPTVPPQLGSPMHQDLFVNSFANAASSAINISSSVVLDHKESDSIDIEQKPSKKFRNSQSSQFFSNFHSLLSLKSVDKHSPLSRSTSELVLVSPNNSVNNGTTDPIDINDSDSICTLPRSQTYCFGGYPQQQISQQQLNQTSHSFITHVKRESPSRLHRKIDFGGKEHLTHSLSGTQAPSPMGSVLLPLSSSAPSFMTPLDLDSKRATQESETEELEEELEDEAEYQKTRPNTPTASQDSGVAQFSIRSSGSLSSPNLNQYPSSPPPTPIHNSDYQPENPDYSPIAPTPVKNTSIMVNNTSIDASEDISPNTSIDNSGSPYKTPSKSNSQTSFKTTSNINNQIFKPQFLSHSSDNMKKRSRTCLDLSILTDKSFDNEDKIIKSSKSLNNHNESFEYDSPSVHHKIVIGMNKQQHRSLMEPLVMSQIMTIPESPSKSPQQSSQQNRPQPFDQSSGSSSLPSSLLSLQSNSSNPNNNNNSSNNNNHHQDNINILDYVVKLPTTTGRQGFNNITPETLLETMKDPSKKMTIIDCRYEYEFNGGHIDSAINIPPSSNYVMLRQRFFSDNYNMSHDHIVVFHCEFSSKRAPECYNLFRWLDREHNHYPNIHYPEIYLLAGGYKKFWETFPESCGAYVTMNDPKYVNEKKIEEDKKKQESKRSRLKSRSHSFHY